MNINRYTEKAQEAILAAQQLAEREGHAEILPEHLLLTLLEQKEGVVPEIVRKMNPDPLGLASAVRAELNRLPRAHGGTQVGFSGRLRQVLPLPSRKPSVSRTTTRAPSTCSSRLPPKAGARRPPGSSSSAASRKTRSCKR